MSLRDEIRAGIVRQVQSECPHLDTRLWTFPATNEEWDECTRCGKDSERREMRTDWSRVGRRL